MAREISSRLKIKGKLVAETPIHVGGYGGSFETDMALAKNGRDEFYIPGTSLTGTLRSWFENNFPNEVDAIWGYQKNDKGHASFVLIEDLPITEEIRNSLQSELRDGVGIDRFYGTAADKAKYDRAILPRGAKLDFEMTVEMQKDEAKIKAMFGHLLAALQNGEIRLGASKTRGLGKVKFEPEEIAENSLKDFDGILNLLRNQPLKTYSIDELKNEDSAINANNANQKLNVIIKWQPKSPLMVKAGYDGIGVDTLPLVSANGSGEVSLCLPGSSVKGVFRAHAERILRTFSENSVKGKDFHDQIKIPIVEELFGSKKEKNGKANLGLGALSIDDCFAELKMNSDDWQEVEGGEFPNDASYFDAGLHKALKKIDGEANHFATKNFQISHHTAVDRFTGAASDGALFSVLKPSPTITWEDLNLNVDFKRFSSEEYRLCALMLLLLVLRDFAQNRLPLGFNVNRGMGEVDEKEIEITVKSNEFEIKWEKGQSGFTFTKGDKSKLEGVWQEWIKTINQTK